jgi:hypothetical protein
MTFLRQHALVSKRQTLRKRLVPGLLILLLAGMVSACGGGSAHIPAATASGPQLYMTPVIHGGSGSTTSTTATYSIDDKALTFAQATYAVNEAQSGAQTNYSGDIAFPGLARGLQELELTYNSCATDAGGCTSQTYKPPQPASGWAVELSGQDGGLLQLVAPPGTYNAGPQPFVPLVPAVTCPSMKSAQAFQFVTLPSSLITSGTAPSTWNPQSETAYGSVDISASGSAVTLANIKQYILPSAGGGTPANAPSSSVPVPGACSPTVYGNTVAIPPNPTLTTTGGNTSSGPQAMMGIGPSGLLVEDNGTFSQTRAPYYENSLGAGTGAIGLPKPSSALSTSSLLGAQYLGFFYGSGSAGSANSSTSLASFGFSSQPSTCAAVTAQTSTMLYGGDFTNNNPAASAVQANGGFGNCDFAIDLGAQDSSNNGLYSAATVYVGLGFAANTTGKSYSFPAVAIAGQLNGKFAIFLIGEDTAGSPNQAWGIYLLQSN